MPEITFQAPKGQRILRSGFFGIQLWGPGSPWWDVEARRWTTDTTDKHLSNTAPCSSFKAFKRHLRRHAKDLEGFEVTLVSRFFGHDIYYGREST